MTKGKTSGRHRSMMPLWIAIIVVLMAELLVYSWCRVQYVQTGYEITKAQQEYQHLMALHRKLKVEEGQLRSPERIRRLATKGGLIMPEPSQIIVLP